MQSSGFPALHPQACVVRQVGFHSGDVQSAACCAGRLASDRAPAESQLRSCRAHRGNSPVTSPWRCTLASLWRSFRPSPWRLALAPLWRCYPVPFWRTLSTTPWRAHLCRLHRYLFRVAPLPHATGGVSVAIGTALFIYGLEILAEGALLAALLFMMPAAGWYGLALLCCLDGYSRYREYQRVRRILARRGYSHRLMRPVASSRCQRDAAVQAARETGHGCRAREYFRSLGYRWYHLLPDRVVDNPLRFFDLRFLRTTFLPGKQ